MRAAEGDCRAGEEGRAAHADLSAVDESAAGVSIVAGEDDCARAGLHKGSVLDGAGNHTGSGAAVESDRWAPATEIEDLTLAALEDKAIAVARQSQLEAALHVRIVIYASSHTSLRERAAGDGQSAHTGNCAEVAELLESPSARRARRC